MKAVYGHYKRSNILRDFLLRRIAHLKGLPLTLLLFKASKGAFSNRIIPAISQVAQTNNKILFFSAISHIQTIKMHIQSYL